MANMVTTKLDTSSLNGALAELARLAGKDFRDVTRNETQEILKKAVSNTPVATVELINKTTNPRLKAQKLAARGLLKKVWVQIGSKLGMAIEAPQYVERAEAPGGDFPEDAEGREKNAGAAFVIEGVSHRFYDPRIFSALAKAVNGRTNFFRTNLRKGVFDKFATIAAKYPGLKVNG